MKTVFLATLAAVPLLAQQPATDNSLKLGGSNRDREFTSWMKATSAANGILQKMDSKVGKDAVEKGGDPRQRLREHDRLLASTRGRGRRKAIDERQNRGNRVGGSGPLRKCRRSGCGLHEAERHLQSVPRRASNPAGRWNLHDPYRSSESGGSESRDSPTGKIIAAYLGLKLHPNARCIHAAVTYCRL